ncbi:TetR/AcrR family transcriptional regulator [Gordonia sp. VNK21]|uniref:TetR/AcrR family transcriptional regulator n=1 Tax=Gordonia sp. VNK21 TaxID=3382483 RepID=UPI0038D45D86
MTTTENPTTRSRLIDAAEELLLTRRYDAVSVRGICARAGANVSAVHYHFGSKENLVAALLEERLAPLWAHPIDGVLSGPYDVADLVNAIWAPMRELQHDRAGALRLSLLARFVLARPDTAWSTRWFQLDSWAGALTESVPGLSLDQARRRWQLAFTLLLSRLAEPGPMTPESAESLRRFLVAGLGDPLTG